MRRALRALFVIVALLCAATALWHASRALWPAGDDASPPARHAVFVVVNVVCALCFVRRPRFFPFVFVLLAAQQLFSHGGDAVAALLDHRAPAVVDVTVALAMPILSALLFVERRASAAASARVVALLLGLVALPGVVACTPPVRADAPTRRAAPTPTSTPAPTPTSAPAPSLLRSFGIVGAKAASAPAAGEYAMRMSMRFETFVTTEMRIAETRHGAARLALGSNGTASACFGAAFHRSVEGQPHYERDPAKRRHSESDDVRLVALAGDWRIDAQGVGHVRFDRRVADTCDVAGAVSASPVVELTCVALPASARVPLATLACTAAGGGVLDLGLPLSGEPTPPADRHDSGPTGDALLFAQPGIVVEAKQERRAAGPELTFTAGDATLREADFRRAK